MQILSELASKKKKKKKKMLPFELDSLDGGAADSSAGSGGGGASADTGVETSAGGRSDKENKEPEKGDDGECQSV